MKLGGVSVQQFEGRVTLTVEGHLEEGEQAWLDEVMTRIQLHPAFVASVIVARLRAAEADLEMDAITNEAREAELESYRRAMAAVRRFPEERADAQPLQPFRTDG